ncbi:hypothetical protein [Nocardia abscessus]|uniref:hypothetical protein n=1 Tax=Nocardia abscessus TaxID=120957 RepID=UPI002456E74E|nr:hypothetical protein [Nocardia abscessus]
MGTFFQELAKKLAERWLTLLIIPGALFIAVAGIGARLGQHHAIDHTWLRIATTDLIAWTTQQPPGSQAAALVALLLAAAGIGLVVQALAWVTQMVWLGPWSRPLTPLQQWRVSRRRRRWDELVDQRRSLEQTYPPDSRTPGQQHEIDTAARRANQVALSKPGRPTWMGDRVHALEQISRNRYGIDLPVAWPHLWLVLPDTARTEIATANAAFAAAVATGTWSWPYLLLSTLWWPAAIIGIGIGVNGWIHARAAIKDLTVISEAALDLHGRSLASTLGVAEPNRAGPLTLSEGQHLTALIRKGR